MKMIYSAEFDLDEIVFNKQLFDEITLVLNDLTKLDKNLIILYYGLNNNKKHTYDQLAIKRCVSREKIRQRIQLILRRLRHPNNNRNLKEFYSSFKIIDR